jgi:hypothetical protein
MHNDLTLKKFGFEKQDNTTSMFLHNIKEMANDSLFYFGLFLSAIFILHVFPHITGLNTWLNIGINEVIVSSIGYVNVFFFKFFRFYFKTNINSSF